MQAKVEVKLPIAICIALVVVSASPVVQYTTVFVEPSATISYENRCQLPTTFFDDEMAKRETHFILELNSC